MIAFKGGALDHRGRRKGLIPRFGAAVWYLHFGEYKSLQGPLPPSLSDSRVVWSSTRNLPSDDPWQAAAIMHATAQTNRRVKEPGYHAGASLHPDESLDREAWEAVADAMLAGLGLDEHQAIVAVHEDRGHQHMHLIVNRVHVDGPVWKPSFDVTKLRSVMRTMERRLGLVRVAEPGAPDADEPSTGPTSGGWDEGKAAVRIREALLEPLRLVHSWEDLDRVLADGGLRLAPARRGGGAVVIETQAVEGRSIEGENERRVSLSRIDPSLSGPRLARRFGEPLRAWLARAPERAVVREGTDKITLLAARNEADRIVESLRGTKATWTENDVQIAAAHRPDLETVAALVHHHPDVQRIAIDRNGEVRFTSHQYLERELLLFETARRLVDRRLSALEPEAVRGFLAAESRLSSEQRRAVLDAAVGMDLGLIAGGPGAGKTTVAGLVGRVHLEHGHDVIGVAPNAYRAATLEHTAGIHSRSIEAWRHAWRSERATLRPGTVVIVDDAGEIETDRLTALLSRIERAGGRAVLIGDPAGLQPIGPGSAFRGLIETHEVSQLGASFRQQSHESNRPQQSVDSDHERRNLEDPSSLASALDTQGDIAWFERPKQAIEDVAERVVRSIDDHPDDTVLAITATRAEAAQINAAVQSVYEARIARHETVSHRVHRFAVGDRIVFGRSDRGGILLDAIDGPWHAVTRGELGTVRDITAEQRTLVIERDTGGRVHVDPERYDHLAPAFALNVHQAAGREVDRTVVLASRHLDQHLARVALSRHRSGVQIVVDRQTAPTRLDLHRILERSRDNDMISDYGRVALGDTRPERVMDVARQLEAHQATWTRKDFHGLAGNNRHLFDVLEEVPEVVPLAGQRWTTRRYLGTELELVRHADQLAHAPGTPFAADVVERLGPNHGLSTEQVAALQHAATHRLALIAGRAGSGKTRMTRTLAAHLEDRGQRLLGASLAGKAADALGREAGIEARTLAAWQAQWRRGEGALSARDVLVIDEASMVDVPTLAAVVAEIRRADASLVLIGDPHQLQAIGPGDAFRALLDRHPAVTLDTVHRQRHAWQAEASRRAATGDLRSALQAYHDADSIHLAGGREAARRAMAEDYLAQHGEQPERAVLLAYRRKDVNALNRAVHEARRNTGELGPGLRFRGQEYSAGDRIILGANDPDAKRIRLLEGRGGVRNGALGTVTALHDRRLEIRLDVGRSIELDPRTYHRFDHGYATTLHKAQGITVEHTYLLAGKPADRAAAYVGLTRHRESLDIFLSREDFPDFDSLTKAMSQARRKTLALDFVDEDTAARLVESAMHELPTERTITRSDLISRADPAVLDRRIRLPALQAALSRLATRTKAERIEARIERRIADLRVTSDAGQQPDQNRRIEFLKRRLGKVRTRLRTVDTKEQIRFEIGMIAVSMAEKEIRTFPNRDQALISSLRSEQKQFLRTLETTLAKLRAGARSGSISDRLRRSILLLANAASRHAIYQLSPRTVRGLIHATVLARVPAAALFYLAPPHLRPLIYGATLARQLVQTLSRSR